MATPKSIVFLGAPRAGKTVFFATTLERFKTMRQPLFCNAFLLTQWVEQFNGRWIPPAVQLFSNDAGGEEYLEKQLLKMKDGHWPGVTEGIEILDVKACVMRSQDEEWRLIKLLDCDGALFLKAFQLPGQGVAHGSSEYALRQHVANADALCLIVDPASLHPTSKDILLQKAFLGLLTHAALDKTHMRVAVVFTKSDLYEALAPGYRKNPETLVNELAPITWNHLPEGKKACFRVCCVKAQADDGGNLCPPKNWNAEQAQGVDEVIWWLMDESVVWRTINGAATWLQELGVVEPVKRVAEQALGLGRRIGRDLGRFFNGTGAAQRMGTPHDEETGKMGDSKPSHQFPKIHAQTSQLSGYVVFWKKPIPGDCDLSSSDFDEMDKRIGDFLHDPTDSFRKAVNDGKTPWYYYPIGNEGRRCLSRFFISKGPYPDFWASSFVFDGDEFEKKCQGSLEALIGALESLEPLPGQLSPLIEAKAVDKKVVLDVLPFLETVGGGEQVANQHLDLQSIDAIARVLPKGFAPKLVVAYGAGRMGIESHILVHVEKATWELPKLPQQTEPLQDLQAWVALWKALGNNAQ